MGTGSGQGPLGELEAQRQNYKRYRIELFLRFLKLPTLGCLRQLTR